MRRPARAAPGLALGPAALVHPADAQESNAQNETNIPLIPKAAINLRHGPCDIPVGPDLGKVFQVGKTTVNAFLEPQYTVWRNGDGMPRWQVFGGVNFQFSIC